MNTPTAPHSSDAAVATGLPAGSPPEHRRRSRERHIERRVAPRAWIVHARDVTSTEVVRRHQRLRGHTRRSQVMQKKALRAGRIRRRPHSMAPTNAAPPDRLPRHRGLPVRAAGGQSDAQSVNRHPPAGTGRGAGFGGGGASFSLLRTIVLIHLPHPRRPRGSGHSINLPPICFRRVSARVSTTSTGVAFRPLQAAPSYMCMWRAVREGESGTRSQGRAFTVRQQRKDAAMKGILAWLIGIPIPIIIILYLADVF